MKRNLFYLICLVASVCITSCAGVSKVVSTARTLEPETAPIVADLDIKTQKVTGVYNFECKKNAVVDEKTLMNNAVYEALKDMKADVLVAPQYQINTRTMGKKYVTVTVNGYPAFYKNFKTVVPKEFAELETVESNNGIAVLIAKDQNNNVIGYQVIVSADKNVKTIDMDLLTLDKVVLDGQNQVVTSSVVVNEPVAEKSNMFTKLFAKKSSSKKEKKNKNNK